MVYRSELTYDEIIDILDLSNIPILTMGYTLPPDTHEIFDINLMLKSLLPNDVKVIFTNDYVRLKSNLTNKKNN